MLDDKPTATELNFKWGYTIFFRFILTLITAPKYIKKCSVLWHEVWLYVKLETGNWVIFSVLLQHFFLLFSFKGYCRDTNLNKTVYTNPCSCATDKTVLSPAKTYPQELAAISRSHSWFWLLPFFSGSPVSENGARFKNRKTPAFGKFCNTWGATISTTQRAPKTPNGFENLMLQPLLEFNVHTVHNAAPCWHTWITWGSGSTTLALS